MFDLKTIPKREKINKQIRREKLISKKKNREREENFPDPGKDISSSIPER